LPVGGGFQDDVEGARQRYRVIAAELAEAERQYPDAALRLAVFELGTYVRAALALLDHVTAERDEARAQIEALEAALDAAEGRLALRASLDRDKIKILWHQRGELAALRGTAPTLLPTAAPQQTHERLDFARQYPVAEVVGRVAELRDDDGVLSGRCPLCGYAGLHVHPEHHSWGCRYCGRWGDSFTFITQYREVCAIEREGGAHGAA
jgi:hypothetical protein